MEKVIMYRNFLTNFFLLSELRSCSVNKISAVQFTDNLRVALLCGLKMLLRKTFAAIYNVSL
jgi:hypothetical protein